MATFLLVSVILFIVASLLIAFVIVILWRVAAFMDVYEGKTEVKYDVTIQGNDTIVDSTVVLKENK